MRIKDSFALSIFLWHSNRLVGQMGAEHRCTRALLETYTRYSLHSPPSLQRAVSWLSYADTEKWRGTFYVPSCLEKYNGFILNLSRVKKDDAKEQCLDLVFQHFPCNRLEDTFLLSTCLKNKIKSCSCYSHKTS